ncbi:helix-turn-helix domain-containing protein [Streptomyces inhibens]|uniref:Helix-turn-helix domain-containing protein n=1 Tax=Streptomyces inhibens TaxID=2293571 RepID=A0A371Q8L3_STRIH|nr:DJ-1/PfpI family protein [Streptomyces inhibens]REK91019.1 helix-turn-helix domain-containing protein [Streptomyces inhibens]
MPAAPPPTPSGALSPTGPRHIVMLAFDGARLLDVTGPLEVFSAAARLGGRYEIHLCSPDGRDITTASGTRLSIDAAPPGLPTPRTPTPTPTPTPLDTLLVPGSESLVPGAAPITQGAPAFPRALPPGLSPALLDSVRTLAARSRRIASICAGAFALAAAGLLDGRRATTHWRHTATLAAHHPTLTVDPDAIYVRDGNLYTSAGVSAGIDLSLALIEADEGPDLAREVARDLVVFMQRPGGQSQFSVPARTPRPRHDALRALLDEIAADPAADHSRTALAARAGLSPRHLARLFREHTGDTPAAYVEAVRLEAAQSFLANGETVTATARRTGIGSDESLRRLFLRRLGIPPSAYRARFRTTTR